jgi:hypothetical protein
LKTTITPSPEYLSSVPLYLTMILANGRMVFAQQSHHVFRVGAFREAREAAQILDYSWFVIFALLTWELVTPAGSPHLALRSFSGGNVLLDHDKAVGTDRDRIDATVDQEISELGMIARRLST